MIAGAGSGKTTTLMEAVKNCSQNYKASEHICLITFTKKAAGEMQERLSKKNLSAGFIGTMHSLAYRIISQNKGSDFNIIQNSMEIYDELITAKYPNLRYIPTQFLFYGELASNAEVSRLKKDYDRYKSESRLYDFDDLIEEAILILNQRKLQSPYPVVLVDEFQDTSPSQLKFIQAMQPEKLFAVGDDWQSIYKFRGADVSISVDFPKLFENTARLFLTKNFRSQKQIVKLGNRVIRLSQEYISKKLVHHHTSESKPVCHIIRKKRNQTDNISDHWEKLFHWNYEQTPLKKFTILVRTNKEKDILAKLIPSNLDFEIMTIHASKGLEFDHVIIWGISHNIIPHRWGDFNEEVRLLYVGVSRAKLSLQFLSVEEESKYSSFLPFLASKCKVNYL